MKTHPRLKLGIAVGLLFAMLFVFAGLALAAGPVHWTYEGEEGPDKWGELDETFATCSTGVEQSPIDIPASATVNPADIVFNYNPTALTISNNGHAIKVDYDAGSSIEVNGTTYNLLQFHFHALSEHTIDGNYAPVEMHLVHQSDAGEFAVVGVMLNEGSENTAYAPVWDNLPAVEGDPEAIAATTVNAADLLPAEQTYYRYNGSFTTPPCTEGVNWFVMSTPVELSEAQVTAFEQIYSNNYRPVQPLNDRTFLETAFLDSGEAEAVPATLPATGGTTFPLAGALATIGVAIVAAGIFLRRQHMA